MPALVEAIYSSLETYHNAKVVARLMALMLATHAGLTSDNLLDLVSGSDDVLGRPGIKGEPFMCCSCMTDAVLVLGHACACHCFTTRATPL